MRVEQGYSLFINAGGEGKEVPPTGGFGLPCGTQSGLNFAGLSKNGRTLDQKGLGEDWTLGPSTLVGQITWRAF